MRRRLRGNFFAGQHLFGQLFDLALDAVEQRPCGRREVKPFGAAVVRVGPALDQAVVAQPVDQPGQGDRLDVEVLGEVGLLEAFAPLQPQQHGPLRPGLAEPAGLLIGVGPEQPAYITDRK
jgi:hypothetical protein